VAKTNWQMDDKVMPEDMNALGQEINELQADGNVTTSRLANKAVTTSKIADGAVSTTQLANTSVSSDKLVNKAVTKTKLADDVTIGGADDTMIGDRIISDGTAPTSNTGKLTGLLSGLANMIKSITGGATWRTVPGMTIATIKTILDAATNLSTANTMIKRDANGRAKVAAPSAADDIARKAEVDVKANTDSPTFTGIPKVPTASSTVSNTQAASTAFVHAVAGNYANDVADATVNAVYAGSTSLDPNTTELSYIVTNHANGPGDNRYWHIYTMFYQSKTGNRAQIAISYNPSTSSTKIATRSIYGTTWTPWEEKAALDSPSFKGVPLVPTPNVNTKTNQIANTNFVHAAIDASNSRGSINVGDINTLTTPGTYSMVSGSWTGYTNAPTAAYAYGSFIVFADGTRTNQIYIPHNGPTSINAKGIWYRSKYSSDASTFGKWNMILTADNMSDYVWANAIVIPANSDLNNYTSEGQYYTSSSANANTVLNKPNVNSSFNLTIKRGAGSWRKQEIDFITGPSFTRWYNGDNATWTDWMRVGYSSPEFVGTPVAPTAAVNTNTTQLATTAFVIGQAGSDLPLVDGTATVGTSLRYSRQDHKHPTDTTRAPLASPSFTGTPTAPTPAGDSNDTRIATTAFVQGKLTAKADLASPALTGTPTAPTAAATTNNTQIATTAFVKTAVNNVTTLRNVDTRETNELPSYYSSDANAKQLHYEFKRASAIGISTTGTYCSLFTDANWSNTSGGTVRQIVITNDGRIFVRFSSSDHTAWRDWVELAPTSSPSFTGTPTAPTAAAGTNNTQLATTAFVTTAVNNKTSITGNAATATKLATARTINGVSFDGTSNITIPIPVTSVAGRTGTIVLAGTDIPAATTSARGTVQLSTATNSTSTTLAATASAVKAAYDRAEAAFQSASDGKKAIVDAITGKGGTASTSNTFAQLAAAITNSLATLIGSKWTTITPPKGHNATGNDRISRLVSSGEEFFILTEGGMTLYKSYDGQNWTSHATNLSNSGDRYVDQLWYAGDRLYAAPLSDNSANYLKYSTNGGITWSNISFSGTYYFPSTIVAGNGYTVFASVQSTNSVGVYYATGSGSSFSRYTIAGTNEPWASVAFGKGMFLLYIDDGRILKSTLPTSASNWTQISTVPALAGRIIYVGGYFVLFKGSSSLYSADGVTWKNINIQLNDLVYAGGVFVARSDNTTIRVSTDLGAAASGWLTSSITSSASGEMSYANGTIVTTSTTLGSMAISKW